MVHTAQMDEGWETARNPRRPSVLEVDSAGNLLLSDDQVASRACSVATCLVSHRAHIIGSQWAQAPGHGDPTTPHNRAWPAIATRLPPRPPPSPSPSTSLSLCVACLACVACWSSAHATKMAPTAPRRVVAAAGGVGDHQAGAPDRHPAARGGHQPLQGELPGVMRGRGRGGLCLFDSCLPSPPPPSCPCLPLCPFPPHGIRTGRGSHTHTHMHAHAPTTADAGAIDSAARPQITHDYRHCLSKIGRWCNSLPASSPV
jgi:hypothetical protein